MLARSSLGAGWESNHYEEPRRVPRASFDFSRRLGPAGRIPGLACGPSGGILGAIRRSRANPSKGIVEIK